MAHPFFEVMNAQELTPIDFESEVMKLDGRIKVVFFWGHNCPNCDQAKEQISQNSNPFLDLGFQWYHVNAYEHMDLAKKFGLHGIPVFLFFYNQQMKGRITTFPGTDSFMEGVAKLKAKIEK